jgi:hypothetical protein
MDENSSESIMKIILSRKGFDSSYGGHPSPILPNGRIITLPIPYDKDAISYSDLMLNYEHYTRYSEMMTDLGIKLPSQHCHLDPDLDASTYERKEGWRPIFGQSEAAQSHLDNQKIEVGDIFLFFGRFNHTINEDGKLKFDTNRHDFHMIFGYLQIGEILRINSETIVPKWIEYHSHTHSKARETSKNTIYVAREKLSLNEKFPGAGMLRFNEDLILTKPGYKITCWNLPEIFRDVNISYHKKESWKNGYFESVSRGQEFVVDANPEIQQWVEGLIERHSR